MKARCSYCRDLIFGTPVRTKEGLPYHPACLGPSRRNRPQASQKVAAIPSRKRSRP